MTRRLMLAWLLWAAAACAASAQETVVLRGRVVDGRTGVPYATLQLAERGVGVCCNEAGDYELKVPTGGEDDSVTVRSMGYEPQRRSVADLRRDGRVRLKRRVVELNEVDVARYRNGRDLMLDVLQSLDSAFTQQTAWSTFFYRDWRTVDDEMYLFDEAVMQVERAPYSQYASKQSYRFSVTEREMETNYKTLLRHRLLVGDRQLLLEKVGRQAGVDQMLEYADDKMFYDPVAAPNASYSLAKPWLTRQRQFALMEFDDGDEGYYLVRATGRSSLTQNTHYEYVVRKRGLALVRITSWIDKPVRRKAPQEAWVRPWFNQYTVERDSTTWIYDDRDGKLTLTRYFSTSTHRLASKGRGHDREQQLWRQTVEWVLTEYSTKPPAPQGDTIASRHAAIDQAFGQSSLAPDFWGHYNTIPISTEAVQLLEQKLTKHQRDEKP